MIKNLSPGILIFLAVLFLFITGCATHTLYDEKYVSGKIEQRSGFELPGEFSDTLHFPPGTNSADGLTVEESAAIALWNNPRFRADLADLGFARADLIEAGMLPNPVFSLLFPLGPKQMEFTLSYAIDVLWQRPHRIAATRLNAEKVAENLVNNGLALVQDVYISFADLHHATEKLKITGEEAALDEEISAIASARMQAGDISEPEETALRLTASLTREKAISARRDMELRKIDFLTLLGLVADYSEIQINSDPVKLSDIPGPDSLIKTGLACRPDLRAAELEIEVAGEHLGWERSKILNLTAMLDANAQGTEGFEMGPGVNVEIPLLYFNKGGRTRARAEMQRAADHYLTVQLAIRSEILRAYQGYLAARKSYEFLSGEILPEAEKSLQNGEQAYLTGEISYLEFLEFRRQLIQARLRCMEAETEVRKNIASIYYSVGGNTIDF